MKRILTNSMRRTARQGLVVSGTLAILLALAACNDGGAQPVAEGKSVKTTPESSQASADGKGSEKASAVKVETVKKAPLVLTLALTGSVEAGRIAQLASPAEGPVLKVQVREGDLVTRGQVMLSLGRTDGANALVSSLNEDLKKEDDNLARTRRLVETGALAGEQLDIASANSVRARALLIKAQEGSRDYAVTAPWAGVVSKMKVRDGDFVGPRAPLAEIYDPQSLIVRLSVPEQAAANVAEGTKVKAELDAYPGKDYSGRVVRLYPYLDPKTRTRIIEIALADGPKLLPGMFARVDLEQSSIANAITVPAYSLLSAPGGGFSAFVMADGKAARRKVETGIEVDGRIRVLSGLEAGDKLIVAGHEKLKEGAPVKFSGGGGAKAGAGDKASGASSAPTAGKSSDVKNGAQS